MLTRYLNRLFERRDLSPLEMEEALRIVTGGEVAHSQIGAFLAALRMKGVSRSELVGAARMLRRAAAFIDCGRREVVDVVGTGGDGSNSFNISTASAFAAAGRGSHRREARQPGRFEPLRFGGCAGRARLQPRGSGAGHRA